MSPPDRDPARPSVRVVDDPADLAVLGREVARSSRLALDVEANSLHAYRERICIVQLTTEAGSAIVDAIAVPDLAPLRFAVDRPDVEVVLHGGDYDVATLSRDHEFRFHHLFDTMIAATLLGDEKVGLADLVRDQYGVELDKRFQTADWRRRPLTPDQIEYLHGDTRYLLGLRDRLHARLADAELLEEAEIEFRRLAARRGKEPVRDLEGWRRLKGAKALDERGRAVVAELFAWREREAEARDVPPFKVLSPRHLISLAQEARGEPAVGRTLPPRLARRHGRAIRQAVSRGLAAARAGRAPPATARPPAPPDEVARRRRERKVEERLRAWRREEARARGVPNLVVLPNRSLAWLARERPRTIQALAAHADIGEKRAARYGEAILAVLSRTQR